VKVADESCERGEGGRGGVLMDDIEKQHLDEARDPLPERVALNPDRRIIYYI
jgi:hypothetical protein